MITYTDIILRFFFAMLIGVIIGTQRERTQHPAGIRTHMLVALSACIVMTTGQLIMLTLRQYGGGFDPARMACQIIPGIGFLGAGTIIHERSSIKGVTTAAGLWATACVGLCVGAGFYGASLLSAGLILLILSAFKLLHTRHRPVQQSVALVKVMTRDSEAVSQQLQRLAARYFGITAHIAEKYDADDEGMVQIIGTFHFAGTHRDENVQNFSFALSASIPSPNVEIHMIRE